MILSIDTHAHVYLDEFDADRTDMLQRARESGVTTIVMPNIDHTSIDAILETEAGSAGTCLAAMGLHPCSIKADFQRELYQVEDWLSKRRFMAIGEMGTDLYWDKSWWPQQVEAFRVQASWAVQYNLPLIIHCRESLEQTIDLVEGISDANLKGVFHCFTGNVVQARRVLALGFKLGIGGVATFRNGGLDKVIPELALGSIVLETDSPYLAPMPHRGKRNEPSYIPLIAKRVAELSNQSVESVLQETTATARALFSI